MGLQIKLLQILTKLFRRPLHGAKEYYDGYGSDGVSRTDLVYIESTRGIAIVADEGMALRAGNGIWIPDDVHIMVNGDYVNLGSVIEDLLAK